MPYVNKALNSIASATPCPILTAYTHGPSVVMVRYNSTKTMFRMFPTRITGLRPYRSMIVPSNGRIAIDATAVAP